MPKPVFWLRASELAAGTILGAGLFIRGSALVDRGLGFAGLGLIFAGVIVFAVPIVFQAKVTRDHMNVAHVLNSSPCVADSP
jgi:hypothetical protein